jgi:hypothetical protein
MTHLTGSEINGGSSVLSNPTTTGTGGDSANYASKLVGGKKSKKAKKAIRKTRKNRKNKLILPPVNTGDRNVNKLKRVMNPYKRLLLPFRAIFGYKH